MESRYHKICLELMCEFPKSLVKCGVGRIKVETLIDQKATLPIPSLFKYPRASSTSFDRTVSKDQESACRLCVAKTSLTVSFKDAVATIRRTGTEFQYQLVVTRAYEEGEEQLLEEDAESESGRLGRRLTR